MKIEPHYPHFEVAEKLNIEFGLSYQGQDWEIVNADAEKIDQFIEYYLTAIDEKNKITMFALLIASIDELENTNEIQKKLNGIEEKVCQNINIHLNIIIYWALIGHGKDKEHVFTMTNYMRSFLNTKLETDKIRIKSPEIIGIEINEINFLKLLGIDNINLDFLELIKYINLDTEPEEPHLEISEGIVISCEKENVFTHFEILSPKYNFQYFKVRTSVLDAEIKKHKIQS